MYEQHTRTITTIQIYICYMYRLETSSFIIKLLSQCRCTLRVSTRSLRPQADCVDCFDSLFFPLCGFYRVPISGVNHKPNTISPLISLPPRDKSPRGLVALVIQRRENLQVRSNMYSLYFVSWLRQPDDSASYTILKHRE